MNRLTSGVILGALLLAGGPFTRAWSEELKVIQAQKTKDAVITLKSKSGQWTKGRNDFILEFTSPKDKQPLDGGKVTLNTSMSMSGMAPLIIANQFQGASPLPLLRAPALSRSRLRPQPRTGA